MTAQAQNMVPVTILTGFLGAGKTTLLNHLLRSRPELKIGVLVNDFGSINIDSELIVGATDDVISLQNGCICCSMKGDLMRSVLRVLESGAPPECLVVEASGVSNPGAIAEMFLELERSRALRLDAVVAVVDAEQFPYDDLKRQPLARDQVIASDLVVLNKTDLAGAERLEAIEGAIRARLPAVRILRAEKAKVPAELIFGQNAGAARHAHHHVHAETELEKLGLVSFSYQTNTPLDLKKLLEVAASLPVGVYRLKGFVCRGAEQRERYLLNVVSRRVHLERIADGPDGGKTTLVAIGRTDVMDPETLRRRFEDCAEVGSRSSD